MLQTHTDMVTLSPPLVAGSLIHMMLHRLLLISLPLLLYTLLSPFFFCSPSCSRFLCLPSFVSFPFFLVSFAVLLCVRGVVCCVRGVVCYFTSFVVSFAFFVISFTVLLLLLHLLSHSLSLHILSLRSFPDGSPLLFWVQYDPLVPPFFPFVTSFTVLLLLLHLLSHSLSLHILSHRSFLLLSLSLLYPCYTPWFYPVFVGLCAGLLALFAVFVVLCSWSCVRGVVGFYSVLVGLLVPLCHLFRCFTFAVLHCVRGAVLLSLFYTVFVVLFFSACFVSFSFFSLPFFLISFAVLLCVRGVVGSPLFSLTLFYLLYMVTRYMCAVLVVMPVFTLMLHHLCFLLRTQRTPLLFTLVLLLVFHLLIIGILLL
jgi:hypothetical protein